MTKSQNQNRRPVKRLTEGAAVVFVGAAGQLLMGWLLAKAARTAELRDPCGSDIRTVAVPDSLVT